MTNRQWAEYPLGALEEVRNLAQVARARRVAYHEAYDALEALPFSETPRCPEDWYGLGGFRVTFRFPHPWLVAAVYRYEPDVIEVVLVWGGLDGQYKTGCFYRSRARFRTHSPNNRTARVKDFSPMEQVVWRDGAWRPHAQD